MPVSFKHSLFFQASQKNCARFLGRILPSPHSPTAPCTKLRQRLELALKTVLPFASEMYVKTVRNGRKAGASRLARPVESAETEFGKKRKVVFKTGSFALIDHKNAWI
jgi:hypothetical protein